MTDTTEPDEDLLERMHDIPRILRALRRAVREALRQHKLAGNPVAVWENGRVVWVQPEDIPDFEDGAEDPS